MKKKGTEYYAFINFTPIILLLVNIYEKSSKNKLAKKYKLVRSVEWLYIAANLFIVIKDNLI